MYDAAVSRRTAVYLGVALALLALGRLLANRGAASSTPPPAVSNAAPPASSASAAPRAPLAHPLSCVVAFGVLTARARSDLGATVDREAVGRAIGPDLCGDERACESVRSTLRDAAATSLEIVATSDWNLGLLDVDASAGALSASDRGSIPKRRQTVAVTVTTRGEDRTLALRTAIATTAAIARQVDGLVHDALLARLETARAFAAHAVTEPLGAGCFRRDRVEILYQPKSDGVVRILSSGMSRWGAPDVEAALVPVAAKQRMAEIVLGTAREIADRPGDRPALTRDAIGDARGRAYPEDAGLPPAVSIPVELLGVRPEPGDPNDFMARIEPPEGDGPIGYLGFAEQFFGPLLELTPDSDTMNDRRDLAQRRLRSQLAAWDARRASGAKMLVQLPFEIVGEAGTEWIWVQATGHDDRTVTGKVVDEPLGATYLAQGSEVTRPLADVQDVRLLEHGDDVR